MAHVSKVRKLSQSQQNDESKECEHGVVSVCNCGGSGEGSGEGGEGIGVCMRWWLQVPHGGAYVALLEAQIVLRFCTSVECTQRQVRDLCFIFKHNYSLIEYLNFQKAGDPFDCLR